MNTRFSAMFLVNLTLLVFTACAGSGGRRHGAVGDGKGGGLPVSPRSEPAGKVGVQVPAAPTLTTIEEMGTPVFAMRVDLVALAASAFVKNTGALDALARSFLSETNESRETMAKCLGADLSLLTNVIRDFSVLGNGQDALVVLIGTVPSARRFVDCSLEMDKKEKRVTREMFGSVQGYRTVEKNGEVNYAVPVAEHVALLIIGEQKELITRLRIGSGDLGRGDVSGYFGDGGHVIMLVSRNLPLEKINDRDDFQIPNLTTGDLTGWLRLTDAIGMELTLDAKNPKAAESLAAFAVIMKGLPDVRKALQGVGLDEKILDEGLRITAIGDEVRVKLALDAVAAGKVAAVLKRMVQSRMKADAEEKEEP